MCLDCGCGSNEPLQTESSNNGVITTETLKGNAS